MGAIRTRVLQVDGLVPEVTAMQEAAAVLRSGGLVAFPTETVYGLGAHARLGSAVTRIFAAKQRPPTVPLIVHVDGVALAGRYARRIPPVARELMDRFWPGPLTLVLERGLDVPDGVTAGRNTVAVRAPDHPVALALIRALGEGIAAPSANPHGGLPPVRASQVLRGLPDCVDLVLDAGRCAGGLESTVLDVTCRPARVLRRGAVAIEQLRQHCDVLPCVRSGGLAPPPASWLQLVTATGLAAALRTWALRRCGQMSLSEPTCGLPSGWLTREMPRDPRAYAAQMYDCLHDLFDGGCEVVFVEAPPQGEEWEAIRDRLQRLQLEVSRVGG